MANSEPEKGHGFGTAPVFLAAICTILGAVMFLRFGYAVGHAGLLGALVIILIGHLITIPTALAVSEIATNQHVEGGGEYFMISRSFGAAIGGTIGISLYASQAASVAFYLIAFAEAFQPVFAWLNAQQWLPFVVQDPRLVSLPAAVALIWLMLKRGADLGVTVLWVVAVVLGASLVAFFAGAGTGNETGQLISRVENPDDFQKVFAIVFPAFTGMTAGVGLSGDLKDPGKSIPLGTMAAVVCGMLAYIAIVVKLWNSASPAELAGDQLIMSKIAVWGPLIPIGLAAATISSAIGSILIAPRTMQALANDRIFPTRRINDVLAAGRGQANEPFNATVLTSAIVVGMIALGDINAVAQMISMFFMITYGSLCGISFLEHFAANPSYRPKFQTKWYFSLVGAVMCFMMMFQMSPLYAITAIVTMHGIYLWLRSSRGDARDLTAIFQGVMFQLTRRLHIGVQKRHASFSAKDWRPSIIMVSDDTFERLDAFDLLRWISDRYGFSTLVHYLPGRLSPETTAESREVLKKLIALTESSDASVFVDTVVSPSYQTALAQMAQTHGISGLENNTLLFAFPNDEPKLITRVTEGMELVEGLGLNVCVLRSSGRRFSYKHKIHIWFSKDDEKNANLMILLAFMIAGHKNWKNAEISVFAAFPEDEVKAEREKLAERIRAGRLPISIRRLRVYPFTTENRFEKQVVKYSAQADLTMVGFDTADVLGKKSGKSLFHGYEGMRDILFVHAEREIAIQ